MPVQVRRQLPAVRVERDAAGHPGVRAGNGEQSLVDREFGRGKAELEAATDGTAVGPGLQKPGERQRFEFDAEIGTESPPPADFPLHFRS